MSDEGVKYTYRRPAPERPGVDWSALAAYAVSRRHGHPPETALIGTGGSGPVGAAEAILRDLAPERLAESHAEIAAERDTACTLYADALAELDDAMARIVRLEAEARTERQRVVAAVVRFIRDRAEPWAEGGHVSDFAARLVRDLEHPGALAPYLETPG